MSYLDTDGHAVGLAAAAGPGDPDALRAVEDVIGEWAAMLRTRRVFQAATPAACSGVRRAQAMFEHETAAGRPLRVSGGGFGRGEQRQGDPIFIPAQGVEPAVRAAAFARGDVVDATCPLVGAVQVDVRRFAARGDVVVVVAGPGALPALVQQAPDAVRVVRRLDDVDALNLDEDRVSFVIGGGVVAENAAKLLAALRTKYPRLRGQHPDGICYATSDQLETVQGVAKASDLVLVLGKKGAPGVRYLTGLAAQQSAPVHQVAGLEDFEPTWLAWTSTIGIVVDLSAKPQLEVELIRALSGMGPLSLVRRGVTTETAKVP
ncbi:hypothetical protein [Amycolatopsis sp. H20-H5]|uniref:hypothetical protein n=1 Tax=Amycolatopsis sp. H20-H5 TaxID=3046309 RepID=UPI002DB9E419|nr:hypothetical protein [Amycolatopsis sp. H20-H5]MEC3974518.1 hypothetical protein [Amycolatopsis sp. H20-H5]